MLFKAIVTAPASRFPVGTIVDIYGVYGEGMMAYFVYYHSSLETFKIESVMHFRPATENDLQKNVSEGDTTDKPADDLAMAPGKTIKTIEPGEKKAGMTDDPEMTGDETANISGSGASF